MGCHGGGTAGEERRITKSQEKPVIQSLCLRAIHDKLGGEKNAYWDVSEKHLIQELGLRE